MGWPTDLCDNFYYEKMGEGVQDEDSTEDSIVGFTLAKFHLLFTTL